MSLAFEDRASSAATSPARAAAAEPSVPKTIRPYAMTAEATASSAPLDANLVVGGRLEHALLRRLVRAKAAERRRPHLARAPGVLQILHLAHELGLDEYRAPQPRELGVVDR